jgi:hypothetical protein
LSAPAVRVGLDCSGLHPQLTRNRRAFPQQNRDCLSDSRSLQFMDGH